MDLKVLFILLVYYSLISIFFISADSIITDDYNTTIVLNDSELQDEEIDLGGLFGTGVSFSRFFGFVGFGIGLPEDTPSWFNGIFIIWQSMISIFTIGFIISSVWNG